MAVMFLFSSCNLIKMKDEDALNSGEKAVARAHNNYLYAADLEGLVPPNMPPQDSIQRVERYINNWAKKQLLIREASQKIEFDEAEIERKILDYRYSLMGYEYQTYYINKYLNTDVSEQEIKAYYEENIDNFALKQNIIRGIYLKVPRGAPRTEKLKSLLLSTDSTDFEELKSFSLSFATAYQLYDSVWMVFDDVVKNSPLAEIPNKVQFLQKNNFIKTVDDDYLYYLNIKEYRISDNTSPLEYVRDNIRNIIINKRKVELAQKLEDEVYKKALEKNEFEIFN
jgi:hypothetical protein